jgi:hypothetical protein
MIFFPLLFGRFLVKAGWVTDAQIQRAAQCQQELTLPPGLLAVYDGLLSLEALKQIHTHQRLTGRLFDEALEDLGFLDAHQQAWLEDKRCQTHLRLGEVLMLQGVLSAEDLQSALESFKDYQTSGVLLPAQRSAALQAIDAS